MRSDALRFAKERYFNGYSDSRSVQENFNLITSFIQDSADKHIPSKTSRSVSSDVPCITPAIRRKIRRKMQLMQKHDWAEVLDNKGQVDIFILDFEKAFDTPPHELLKSKLFSYGIGGKTL